MSRQFYCLEIIFGTPEFDEALNLRYNILRKPLNMEYEAEDIAKEFDSIHLGCYDNITNEIAGVLVLKPLDKHVLKMRQVAVDVTYQSKGVGTFLVSESEKLAKSLGYIKIELHARDTAIDFYLKSGYSSSGLVFKEVGIDHQFMSKNLDLFL